MIFNTVEAAAETVAGTVAETIAGTIAGTDETVPVALEIQSDLAHLKPNILLDTLRSWTPELIRLGYYLLQAVLIVVIGLQIARVARRLLRRTLDRTGMDLGISRFLISVANVLMYTVIILAVAERIGIPSASIIAVLGSAGLAIGLALQGSLANFAGSIVILIMRPFTIEDYIVFSGGEGTVKNIGLVYTTLTTGDNRCVSVPNGQLANTTVTNVTRQDKRRLEILVGIGYTSDLKQAKQILEKLLTTHPLVLTEEPVAVFVSELADSAVIIGGRAWTATGDNWTAKCEIIEQLKLAYDSAGIEIPYNQLDVHMVANK